MAIGGSQVQEAPIEAGGERYIPVPLDSLRLDSTPTFNVYFRPGAGQPFVLYCERNLVFTSEASRKLRESKIELLYIRQDQRQAYAQYLATHLEDVLGDRQLPLQRKAAVLYDAAQAVVENVLDKPGSKVNLRRGKEIVRRTVEFMSAKDFMIEYFLRTISCDYYLYTHSINVVAYSVALAQRAGMRDAASLRELANGALFHDVGKRGIGDELLSKKQALTTGEWELIRKHPEEGYQLLERTEALGEIALDIVLHHHERLDGGGYPHGLQQDEISNFVRIVSIADVFDALTTDRHHQPAQSTFEALQVMGRDLRRGLDPVLLKIFVELMGGTKKR